MKKATRSRSFDISRTSASQMMTVRPMEIADVRAVLDIHRAAYPDDHDSSHLSTRLLARLYECSLRRNQFSYVAIDATGQIVGFVVAGAEVDQTIREFRRRSVAGLIVSVLTNRRLLKSALRRARTYMRHPAHRTVGASPASSGIKLLSIAIRPEDQRRGVGRALTAVLHEHLRTAGYTSYTVAVRISNVPSNTFFRSIGAAPVCALSDSSLRYHVDLTDDDFNIPRRSSVGRSV